MARIFRKTKPRWERDVERIKEQRAGRYADVRAFFTELVGGCCRICGTDKDPWFEYIGKGKGPNLTSIFNCSISKVMEQRDNFGILCKKHWWEKHNKSRHEKIEHGTITMYGDPHNCRCPQCRNAWVIYQREYFRRRRAKKKAAIELLKKGKLSFLKDFKF